LAVTVRVKERRKHERCRLSPDVRSTVEFTHESFDGLRVTMRLRDVSGAGLSFQLERDVPGLEVGDTLDGVVVTLGDHVIPGDLLVMRVSPDSTSGSTCGCLFYPQDDDGIRALQQFLIAALARSNSAC
jgi:hypothetical protein